MKTFTKFIDANNFKIVSVAAFKINMIDLNLHIVTDL